jgi:hypothetical protein
MIIALAGRRIDGIDAKKVRFPLRNVDTVRMRVRAFLRDNAATALVSSAACGADLIGLSEAGQLGIGRRVILPFESRRFRETSVIDRPGDWGILYDQVLHAVQATGDLLVLQNGSDSEAYLSANRTILDEAVRLATAVHASALALLVWDGVSRGDHDVTEKFAVEARRRGLALAELRTNE